MQFFPTFLLLPLFYSEYFPWHSLLEPNAINIAIWCNSSNKVTGYLLDDRNSNWKQAQIFFFLNRTRESLGGRDSGNGIAILYRLDGLGIKYQITRFSAPVQTVPGAHPSSHIMGTGSFPGVKLPACIFDYPTPSSAEAKERLELHFYIPSGPSWPVLGWTLPLHRLRYLLSFLSNR